MVVNRWLCVLATSQWPVLRIKNLAKSPSVASALLQAINRARRRIKWQVPFADRTGSSIFVENVDPGAIQTLLDDIERLRAMITLTGSRPHGLNGGQFDRARA